MRRVLCTRELSNPSSTRTQKSRGALRSIEERLVRRSPLPIGRAVRSRAGVSPPGSPAVKKASAPSSASVFAVSRKPSFPCETTSRWKVPRAGEHRVSSRKSGVARPYRRRRPASAPRRPGRPRGPWAEAVSLSPRAAPGRVKEGCPRQEAPEAGTGWGEVSATSNRRGERRGTVFFGP
jgi:hypothetical protein